MAHSENSLSQAAAFPPRILYVEDNPIVREVTAELLTQDGRHIVATENAEEALQEFGRGGFDLVITDVSLPNMSGMDLARNILQAQPHTAIIIASGYFIDLTLEKWGRRVRSIVKPFSGAEIDALIMKVCDL